MSPSVREYPNSSYNLLPLVQFGWAMQASWQKTAQRMTLAVQNLIIETENKNMPGECPAEGGTCLRAV